MKGNKKIMIIGGVIATSLVASSIIALGYYTSEGQLSENKTSFNEKHNTVSLTIDDNSSNVDLEIGDTVVLTLKDYGDGGYSWDTTDLNQDILKLDERTHEDGSGMLGDFGNDVWTFTALSTGSTSLELVCKQPWADGDIAFTANFLIQVS